jgi:DNA-binding transcriptional MerR regulator
MPAQTFTIGELAREFALTTRAMRFYEDKGLLSPARTGPGGLQRVYGARDRTRLALALRAKRLGLSLSEVKDILDMYDSPRDTVPQLEKFLGVLGVHRTQLEVQLAELQGNLDDVRAQEEQARAALVRARASSASSASSSSTGASHAPAAPRKAARKSPGKSAAH